MDTTQKEMNMEKGALVLPFLSSCNSNSSKTTEASLDALETKKRETLGVSSSNYVFTVRENVRKNGVGIATIEAFRENGSFSLQDLYSKGMVGRAYVVAYADGENPGRPALNSQSSNIATLLVP